MAPPIYMDNHATTAVDPRVLEAMLPTFRVMYGNAASSEHVLGWQAEALVQQAREQVAGLLHCSPGEIVFTSGATESINLALLGATEAYERDGDHVVTVVTEHKAALDCCERIEQRGMRVTRLDVAQSGIVEVDRVRDALTDATVLVSVMTANNEIGTLQPIAEIGALARERGIIMHTDAAQAVGKVQLDLETLPVDLLSVSAHKMYGPKGAGALFVRRRDPRVALVPRQLGGGHERGLRSGTLNVHGIVGLGAACAVAAEELAAEAPRLARQRDRLLARLTSLDGVIVNGDREHRLPGNLNISFEGIPGAALVSRLRRVAVSSGAACTSADPQPSHVLRALGVPDQLAKSTLRFGLGRFTTDEEVEAVADHVAEIVATLRVPRTFSATVASNRKGSA